MPRLDQYLVHHGHFESRAKAQEAIKAGLVTIDGRVISKPSVTVNDTSKIEAEAPYPWVSRGGVKLAHALEQFKLRITGRTCLDIGASTGGFTDVLLANGAAYVYAVDVGSKQLHTKLRTDSRVCVLEQTDARTLTQEHFHTQRAIPSLIVCDASFISAKKVLARPLSLLIQGADLITLVKPQFEVGKSKIGKNGIVTDDYTKHTALMDVITWLKQQGWSVKGHCMSPITGGDGNEEYLVWASKR